MKVKRREQRQRGKKDHRAQHQRINIPRLRHIRFRRNLNWFVNCFRRRRRRIHCIYEFVRRQFRRADKREVIEMPRQLFAQPTLHQRNHNWQIRICAAHRQRRANIQLVFVGDDIGNPCVVELGRRREIGAGVLPSFRRFGGFRRAIQHAHAMPANRQPPCQSQAHM